MKNLLIATFSFRSKGGRTAINGMIEPLLSVFLKKTKSLTLIDGSHPGGDTIFTLVERYKQGKITNKTKTISSLVLWPLLKIQNKNSTQVIFKLRDFLDVLEIGLGSREGFDLFIGLESIYTLAGILLRKLGKTKKVVYYVSDYSPYRFGNRFAKSIYLWLDRFCCYNADYIWDVSPVMMPARIKAGIDEKKIAPLIIVPNALFEKQISYLSYEKLEKDSLVFVGTLGPENGPQVAVKAMRQVLRQIPSAKLHIIGGNDDFEKPLRSLVSKLNLENNVIFHGFISDAVKVSRLAQEFMVGLAPYTQLPDSPRWFADATKIRLYMGIGLPIITTKVPPLGKEVALKGAALIVKDDEKELANACIKLLEDKNLYSKMRKAAIDYAKNNTWGKSYGNALSRMKIN